MDTRKGGHRYCPGCKKNVETRVLLEGIPRLSFTASWLKGARSYAKQTLKGQVGRVYISPLALKIVQGNNTGSLCGS